MAGYDVAVIGGGPAGYSAALRAAELGASVVLIEAEKPGGACVHHACIPTNILLNSAALFVEAQEQAALGVFQAGEAFSLGRAAARKDALVKKLADGIQAALRMRRVKVVPGRARFVSPHALAVAGGDVELTADAFVIATGTRWAPPQIPGIAPERILTADQVQSLVAAPASALVLGGGPADTAFALEYAVLLSLAGATVSLATPHPSLLPALDPAVAAVVRAALVGSGIAVFEGAAIAAGRSTSVELRHAGGTATVDAEVVVAADVRVPSTDGLALEAAGVALDGTRIPVDRSARTNVAHIFAAGDVTGGLMLTNAAQHMGEVAGENAAGGDAATRLGRIPHLLHTVPECGWVGMTEAAALAAGHDVVTGMFDLAYNARAVTLGAREGLVKVVADRLLGEILGVHVTGPGAAEIVNLAAFAMQAELRVDDLAAFVAWHPSMAEGLAEAARRTLAAR